MKSLFKSSINEKKNDKSVLVCNKKRMIIHHSTTNTNKKRVDRNKTKETNDGKIKEKLEVEKVLPALVWSPMQCGRRWLTATSRGMGDGARVVTSIKLNKKIKEFQHETRLVVVD